MIDWFMAATAHLTFHAAMLWFESLTTIVVTVMFAANMRWYMPLAWRWRSLPTPVAFLAISQTVLFTAAAVRLAWWALAPIEWRQFVGKGFPNGMLNVALMFGFYTQMRFHQESIPLHIRPEYPLWRVPFFPHGRDGWIADCMEYAIRLLTRNKTQ